MRLGSNIASNASLLNKRVFTRKVSAIGLAFLLSACNEPNASGQPSFTDERKVADYVVYDGPSDQATFATKYNGSYCSGTCIVQMQPVLAPIKKSDGAPLCIVPEYEHQTVLVAYFSRDNSFRGASCQISQTEYESIRRRYGTYNVFAKYLDQRFYQDFLTWRTDAGYVTTFKEMIRRLPNGTVLYHYFIYLGSDEHPHRSQFRAD